MKLYTKKWRIAWEKGRAHNNINWKKNTSPKTKDTKQMKIFILIYLVSYIEKEILNISTNSNKDINNNLKLIKFFIVEQGLNK